MATAEKSKASAPRPREATRPARILSRPPITSIRPRIQPEPKQLREAATSPERARASTAMQQRVGNARAAQMLHEDAARGHNAAGPAGTKVAASTSQHSQSIPHSATVAMIQHGADKQTQHPMAAGHDPKATAPPKSIATKSSAVAHSAAASHVTPSPAHSKTAHGAHGHGKSGHAHGQPHKEHAVDPHEKHGADRSAHAALAPLIHAVHHRATVSSRHSPHGAAVGSAQSAAVVPQTEQTRLAASQTVKNLDAADVEKVKRDEFKAKLKEAINRTTQPPTTESQADEVMKEGAKKASSALSGQLATERDAAAGTLKSAATTEVPPSTQAVPEKTNLQPEPLGAPPSPVSASPAVPAPLPPEQLDYSSDRAPTDKAMAESGVTKEQLAKGNEPSFTKTVADRQTVEAHEAATEGRYRKSESTIQDHAHAAAQAALAGGLGAIHGVRGGRVGRVVGQQLGTMTKNALERQRITQTINGIKNKARTDVEEILKPMEAEASTIFEAGLAKAEKAYQDTFDDAKGGIGTWLTTWGDDWKELIENSLGKARNEYFRYVDVAIDEVSNYVDGKLKAAKARVAAARKEVEDFVKGLDEHVLQFGQEALQKVSEDFDAMSSEIDQRRDALVDKLAEQYKASHERMSAMEEKLREENKSLWERIYDATVGLIKKILAFKDMLLSILAKAVGVIGDIISDPIGFLGNLVSAVMQGLRNFIGNIGAHLKKGLMDWLFGALGGAGLKLPENFDLEGIVSIVLQVLGLTYANFRARAVAIVGEPVVAALEQAAEVFKVVISEGIPGLWRFIKDKLNDLKSMVLDAIFDFIKEKVIVAGITWVIGLLNPASAFFKACKAIYDIVIFFINRGSQILALVNAIIDSMAAIAKGSLDVAAKWVEDALAKAIPVAIGFLASLLGLGDISSTIKNTIDKAQAPVNKAIDWVINLAVKGVKAAGKFVGGLFGKAPEKKPAGEDSSTDLRNHVRATLTERLKGPHSRHEAHQIVKATESEYKSLGLKSLEVAEETDEGVTAILAEASAKRPLAELARQVPKPKGRSVVSRVQLIMSEPVEVPATELKPADPTKLGVQIAGVVWTPSVKASKKLNVVTWNTSDVDPPGNSSHAEHQFVEYMESRHDLWTMVEKITISNVSRSPCSACGPELAMLLKEVKTARVGKPVEAEIFWTKLHGTGAQPTSSQTLREMQAAGWRLIAPPEALPPEGGVEVDAVIIKPV
jgi:hypothetical protein